jgi:hypothetical protein
MFTKVGAAVKVIGSTYFHSVSVFPWKENQEKSGQKYRKKCSCLHHTLFRRVKPQTFLLEVPCSTFIEIS